MYIATVGMHVIRRIEHPKPRSFWPDFIIGSKSVILHMLSWLRKFDGLLYL